jgi:hypothetical protein
VGAPFAFALVLATGPGAAALVAAASCALFDLAHRKPARKVALNVGTHTIGLTVRAVISPGRVLRQSVLARDDAERTARRGGRAAGPGDAGDGRPPGAAPAGADRAAAAGGPVRQRPGELPGECAERVQVDAADLLEEAATEARAGACGDRVRVRCDHSLAVRTTPDVILQILGNLVDNACKYAPEDRPVWLVGGGGLAAVDGRGLGSSPAGRSRPDPPLRLDALA